MKHRGNKNGKTFPFESNAVEGIKASSTLILIAVQEHRRRKDLFCLEGRIEEILQKKLHHKGMKDVQASDK